MNQLFFPVVGAMLVFFVVIPLLTVAARAAVSVLPGNRDQVTVHESSWRLMLIVGPTLGPIVWLVSAAIHQSEAGAPLAACVVDHIGGELCQDVVLFGLILFSILGVGVVRRLQRQTNAGPARAQSGRCESRAKAEARVVYICKRNPALRAFTSRVGVVKCGAAPVCTWGLLRPRVEIESRLVGQLEDDELEATLLHEIEHANARDPLRFFVAQVALSINPLGRTLSSALARYHFAREVLCDKRAVQRGADPLALARSIVSVASPAPVPVGISPLGGHGIGGIKLRVHLLLGYASHWPGPIERRAPVGLATTALVALLAVWPHVMGTGPLDFLHHSIERAALLFGLG